MDPRPLDAIHDLLGGLLPIKANGRRLRLCREPEPSEPGIPPPDVARGGLTGDGQGVAAHLALDGLPQSVEGTIYLVYKWHLGDMGRAETYLRGWAAAIREVLERGTDETLDGLYLYALSKPELIDQKSLRGPDDFKRALLGAKVLGKYMPPPQVRDAQGRLVVDIVRDVLADVLPIKGGVASLERGGSFNPSATPLVFERVDEGVVATLQVFTWDITDTGERTVRDIKEQEVPLVLLDGYRDPNRVEPYLRGWAAAVQEIFEKAEGDTIECSIPHDFTDGRALSLKRPRSPDEWKAALLVPSRLGGLLKPRKKKL